MWLCQRILLIVRQKKRNILPRSNLCEETQKRKWDKSRTRVLNNAGNIPDDRLCSVFCEQIGERRIGTQTRRQGRSEKGREIVASTAVEKEEKEEKRRWRKTRKRSSSSSKEAESIVTFFLCLSPCKSPLLSFFSRSLSFSSYPKFHTGAPCGIFYLPKAITNAPARTQVCSIVVRPTYRVPRPRFALLIMCLAIISR